MTTLLIGIYIACELIANITAARPVEFFGLVAPGGVFIYALTFTLLDLLHERLGYKGVRMVVYTAFTANALWSGQLPTPEPAGNHEVMQHNSILCIAQS